MQEAGLFEDGAQVKTITPYRKLRELRGISQEKAAEIFNVSRRTILDVENNKRDASKQLVRRMDEYYGCKGALIAYWLPKFSLSRLISSDKKTPFSFMESIMALIKLLML